MLYYWSMDFGSIEKIGRVCGIWHVDKGGSVSVDCVQYIVLLW